MKSTKKKILLIPDAHLLLTSLRSVGYKPETAIADIVDNSIAASGNIIDVYFDWKSEKTQIVIVDNGFGMNQDELIKSMKIGSSNPNEIRDTKDLGRFGMGLKTAAFSLGKKLTVISKNNNEYANACWDLNYIEEANSGEWELLIDENYESLKYLLTYLENCNSGTLVVIEELDGLIESQNLKKSKDSFYKLIAKVSNHLSLIFHRFIEEDGLKITINKFTNKEPILPWNPFVVDNIATQELGEEEYSEEDKLVKIQPYVLPHKTKFSSDGDYENAGGFKGWTAHQGIYVYRNRRLLIYGKWFDIIKKEPAFNLARIKLDIDSFSDHDWKIDIKKSDSSPPIYIREILERAVTICTETSARVYNSRGTYSKGIASTQLSYVWEQRKSNAGRYSFYINKKHPLLNEINNDLNAEGKQTMKSYLSLIENHAPFMQSGIVDHLRGKGETSSQNDLLKAKTDIKEIKGYIKCFLNKGYLKEEIKPVIIEMANYRYLEEEILAIFKEEAYD